MVEDSIQSSQFHGGSAPGPLSHIKVLDLSRSLAGPWAAQVFSDFGADVIKVEHPKGGDECRIWGPPFLEGTSDSPYFLMANRGKRSITLDLSRPEAQEVVRRLAQRSDVLIENYKVGGLAKFGLSYEDLRKVNPRLIYCSVTGFGQDGPRSGQAAYDFAIQAMSGLMSITGVPEGSPGAGPQKVGVPIVDIITGLYAAIGALVGLVQRERTDSGEHIDLALLDAAIAGISSRVMSYLLSGAVPKRTGNLHPTIQPQDAYVCIDGSIAIAVGNDTQFVRLCDMLGRSELAADEKYKTNASRVRNSALLRSILTDIFKGWKRDALVSSLEDAGVPCSPINSIAEAVTDPQVVHRGLVRDAPHRLVQKAPQVSNPLKFASWGKAALRAHPGLGEHSSQILAELGYSGCEVEALCAKGIS